mmetsp:Transcript_7818/g.11372  ORF Transcript_7818/g.11372 Transcript_7818/m.11372 type:complete len:705 (-) Transcript_7818:177-2291(-)|eukprot:CAMPEP_0194031972 /NCGR_PEP_ID=MMETSP0009_2-20130614/5021_1 /TAXON_ID=210454 /ORGANISM="Grammatophora oceanica, Strain CCMP 410" /LENGTH=704 /DNA_ID=CAMNT_0038672271 /DNA_START=107 /DNA_END=2221 /DNA_ORIENTATION=-
MATTLNISERREDTNWNQHQQPVFSGSGQNNCAGNSYSPFLSSSSSTTTDKTILNQNGNSRVLSVMITTSTRSSTAVVESERSVLSTDTANTTGTGDDGEAFFQRQSSASELRRLLAAVGDDGGESSSPPSGEERKTADPILPRESQSERAPVRSTTTTTSSLRFPYGGGPLQPPNAAAPDSLDQEDLFEVDGGAYWMNNNDDKSERSGLRDSLASITPSSSLSRLNGDNTNFDSIPATAASSIDDNSLGSDLSTPPKSTWGSTSLSRPMLYSAIGSLESASGNSYGRIRQKMLQGASSGRDFQAPAATGLMGKLILPPPTASTSADKPAASEAFQPKRTSLAAVDVTVVPLKKTSSKVSVASMTTPEMKNPPSARDPSETGEKGPVKVLKGRKSSSTSTKKKVTIDEKASTKKKRVEMFRPSCDAYTPRMGKKNIKYKPAEMRTPVQKMSTEMGTLHRPNFKDALRRVAMIIKQHIVKIEQRMEGAGGGLATDTLFNTSMQKAFSEDRFVTPRYKCTMVRVPMARPGMVYGMRKLNTTHKIPTEEEIYEFGHQLFKSVQLSSECSIVCLIYVERLMENAKVPLISSTWRPIFMCGLLLASKVWQDLSSWNIEFASVYPQFSLDAINKLEVQYLRMVKWDLYISSSLYAKYYFALRSILEKPDFRQRYNRMVAVGAVGTKEALKVQQRSTQVKEEALLQLSRSM